MQHLGNEAIENIAELIKTGVGERPDWYYEGSFTDIVPKEYRDIFLGCIDIMSYYTTQELGGWELILGKSDKAAKAEIFIEIRKKD